jgi:opacity protein-like surface antigen
MQSWADCITGTHVSSFWKQQGSASAVVAGTGTIHTKITDNIVRIGINYKFN